MTDTTASAELAVETSTAVLNVEKLTTSLDFLEQRMDKMSRTGTRNITNLRNSFTSELDKLVKTVEYQTAAIVHALEAQADANISATRAATEASKIARLAKEAELKTQKEFEAMWDSNIVKKKAIEEGKILLTKYSVDQQLAILADQLVREKAIKDNLLNLDKLNAAQQAAILSQKLSAEKVAQATMEAGWMKTLAARKATEDAILLYTAENNAKLLAQEIAANNARKLIGRASPYTPGITPIGGTSEALMTVKAVSKLNEELAKTPAQLINVAESTEKATIKGNLLSNVFKKLSIDGNDVHSVMRGLASGFGLLWLTWGNLVPLFAGAALSVGFTQALSVGSKVVGNLADVGAMAGYSADEMDRVAVAIDHIGSSSKFGPVEASEAIKVLALAGIGAEDAIKNLKTVLDFSTLGGTGLEKSTEALVAISTAFGYGAQGMATVADTVAKTAAVSMATVDGMTASFRSASVAAQQYGVSLDDMALQLAFMSQIGIKGTAAGTAVANMYQHMVGGSKQAQKELEKLGITIKDADLNAAKPLSMIIGELSIKLAGMTVKQQDLSLANMSTNRGLRDLSATLAAFRTKVQELDPTTAKQIADLRASGHEIEANKLQVASTITVYEKFQKLLEDAPGFAALAAAEKSLAADQQWGAVKAAMANSLNNAFRDVSDTLYILGAQLRTLFNSKEFQSGLSSIVQTTTHFIGVLISGVESTTKFANSLWEITKAVAAIGIGVATAVSVFRGFEAIMLGLSTVFFTVVTSLMKIRTALLAVEAASYSFLASPAGWIALAASVIAAGTAYYLLGGHVTEAEKKAKAASDSAAERVKADKIRINDFNNSIDEAIKGYKQRAEAAATGVSQEIIAAEEGAAAQKLRSEATYALDRSTTQLLITKKLMSLADLGESQADKQKAKQLNEEVARANVHLALIDQLAKADTDAIDKRVAELKTLAAAEKARVEAGVHRPPHGTEDIPEPLKVNGFKIIQDSNTEILTKALSDQSKLLDNAYKNDLARLQSKNQSKLISDGQYTNQAIVLAAQYEHDKITLENSADEQLISAYTVDVNKVIQQYVEQRKAAAAYFSDKKKFSEWELSALDTLHTKIESYSGTLSKQLDANKTAREEAKNNIYTVMSKAIDKTLGDMATIQKAYDEFNIKEQQTLDKTNRQTKLEDQLRYASPEARAWLTATSAEQERLTTEVSKLEKQLRDATLAMADFNVESFDMQNHPEQIYAYQQALEKRNELERQFVAIKNGEATKIADAGARASLKLAQDNIASLAGGLADAVETAITDGGTKGGDKLWQFLQQELLLKPFKIYLTGVLGDVIGTINGLAGGASGVSGGLTSLGSGISSATGLYKGGSMAYGWLTSTGASSTAGSASSIYSLSSGPVTSAGLDAQLATGSTSTAGASSAMGFLSTPAGALAAALIVGDLLMNAGSQYISARYTGGVNTSYSPTGAVLNTNTDPNGLKAALANAGNSASFIDSTSAEKIVAGVSTYYLETAKKLGVATLAMNLGYGSNTGRQGENPNFTMTAQVGNANYISKTDNPSLYGANEVSLSAASLGLEATKVVLTALQASTLPKYLSGIFNDLIPNSLPESQISGMTQQAATDALNLMQSYADLHTQLQDMPFVPLRDMTYSAYKALVTFSGGMSQLGTDLGSFYDKFYTAEEKRKQTLTGIISSVTAVLPATNSLGFGIQLQNPLRVMFDNLMADAAKSNQTDAEKQALHDRFRVLVDTAMQDTSTAGLLLTSTLLKVSTAFDSVEPAAAAVATALSNINAIVDMDIKIYNLLGKTQQEVALTRQKELDALDSSLRPIQLYINALQDEADLKAQIITAYNSESAALTSLITGLGTSIQNLQTYKDGLKLGNNSILTPKEQYMEAQRQFDSTMALANGTATTDAEKAARDTAIGQLPTVANTLLDSSKVLFASGATYNSDYAKVMAAVNTTMGQLETQKTTAQSQLDALTTSVNYLFSINQNVATVADLIPKYLTALQSANSLAPAATTAGSIAAQVQSVGTSSSIVNSATSNSTVTPASYASGSTEDRVQMLYSNLIGRVAEKAGMDYWAGPVASATTAYAKQQLISQFAEAAVSAGEGNSFAQDILDGNSSAYIPGFRNGGYAKGSIMVGEAGPELIDLKTPGRVYNAAETNLFGDNRALLEELKALREEVAQLRKEQQVQTGHLITANYDASKRAADNITQATEEAAANAVWAKRSIVKLT